MYHAMTSLQSGIAICILTMFFARKYWGMENYIKIPQFWALSKLQLATTVLWSVPQALARLANGRLRQ